PLQPQDDRGDPPPAGGGQGEVRRGRAVRIPPGAGPEWPVPVRLGAECRGSPAVGGPGGRLCLEDDLAATDVSAGESAAAVQGAVAIGASVPPPQGPAGGGADVPEGPGADGGAAVHPDLGADGAGADGAAGAAGDERPAAVWTVPGGSAERGADGPGADGGLQRLVHRDRPAEWGDRPPTGRADS